LLLRATGKWIKRFDDSLRPEEMQKAGEKKGE